MDIQIACKISNEILAIGLCDNGNSLIMLIQPKYYNIQVYELRAFQFRAK